MPQAENLASLISGDLQLQIPEYPRLSEDFLQIQEHSRLLIISGGSKDKILRGKSVKTLLRKLIPLLDGRHSIDDLKQQLPKLNEKHIDDALALLYMQGVLSDGRLYATSLNKQIVRQFRSQLAFYSRYIDDTRMSRNRYDVLDTLQKSRVLLVGECDVSLQTGREMIEMGVGHVDVLSLDHKDRQWQMFQQQAPHTTLQVYNPDTKDTLLADDNESPETAHDLIIFVTAQPRPDLREKWVQFALTHDTPLLQATIHPQRVQLGPIWFPHETACPHCATLQHELYSTPVASDSTSAQSAGISAVEQMGVSHIGLMTLSTLTRIRPVSAANVVYTLHLESLNWMLRRVYHLPGCPTCGRAEEYDMQRNFGMGASHQENLPTLYHLNSSDMQYATYPKAHQAHYRPETMESVEHAYKAYPNHKRIDLPDIAPDDERFTDAFGKLAGNNTPQNANYKPVTLHDVAVLLQIAASHRKVDVNSGWEIGLRVTPSGGSLASQTLYLVNFSLADLEPGVYHYNTANYLELLERGQFQDELLSATRETDALSDTPCCAIVGTNFLARVEAKYRSKAYRYVMLDAGAMLHSLQYISQVLSLDMWQSFDFYDDRVNTVINNQTPAEITSFLTFLLNPEEASPDE